MNIERIAAFMLLAFLAASCQPNTSATMPTASSFTATPPNLPPPTSTFQAATPSPATSTPIPPVEGITTAQINIRAEASKESAALGMLNIFTKVWILGKDSSGGWYKIIHADSFGWVSASYIQVDSGIEIPLIPAAEPSPSPSNGAPTPSRPIARMDGDTMQSPILSVVFSQAKARAVQLNGEVSTPDGDVEDWLQFTSRQEKITIKILCPGSPVNIELWNSETRADVFLLACGSEKTVSITADRAYWARFSAPADSPYVAYRALLTAFP